MLKTAQQPTEEHAEPPQNVLRQERAWPGELVTFTQATACMLLVSDDKTHPYPQLSFSPDFAQAPECCGQEQTVGEAEAAVG